MKLFKAIAITRPRCRTTRNPDNSGPLAGTMEGARPYHTTRNPDNSGLEREALTAATPPETRVTTGTLRKILTGNGGVDVVYVVLMFFEFMLLIFLGRSCCFQYLFAAALGLAPCLLHHAGMSSVVVAGLAPVMICSAAAHCTVAATLLFKSRFASLRSFAVNPFTMYFNNLLASFPHLPRTSTATAKSPLPCI